MKSKILLSIVFSFLTFTSFSQIKETRDINSFSGIHVIGNIRCEIFPAEKEKVEIIVSGSETDNIITEKKDGILSLRLKTNTPREANIKIKVYYNSLNTLISQAQALIINKDTLNARHIDFEAKGGGKMELLLNLESLSADVKQGGILVFSGIVDNQNITVTTGGTYSAYKLQAKDSYVKTSSGGKAKVIARRIIDASANTKSFIGYIGNPVSTYIKTNLGGQIEHTLETEE